MPPKTVERSPDNALEGAGALPEQSLASSNMLRMNRFRGILLCHLEIGPNLANLPAHWPIPRPIWRSSGHIRSESLDCGYIQTNAVEFDPHSVKSGPKPAASGPTVSRCGRCRPKLGRFRANFGRLRTTFPDSGSKLAEFGLRTTYQTMGISATRYISSPLWPVLRAEILSGRSESRIKASSLFRISATCMPWATLTRWNFPIPNAACGPGEADHGR